MRYLNNISIWCHLANIFSQSASANFMSSGITLSCSNPESLGPETGKFHSVSLYNIEGSMSHFENGKCIFDHL